MRPARAERLRAPRGRARPFPPDGRAIWPNVRGLAKPPFVDLQQGRVGNSVGERLEVRARIRAANSAGMICRRRRGHQDIRRSPGCRKSLRQLSTIKAGILPSGFWRRRISAGSLVSAGTTSIRGRGPTVAAAIFTLRPKAKPARSAEPAWDLSWPSTREQCADPRARPGSGRLPMLLQRRRAPI